MGDSEGNQKGGGKDLKSQNRRWLVAFVVLHLAIFWSLASVGVIEFDVLEISLKAALLEKGVFAICAFLLVIILEGLIPTHLKSMLVFWRWRHPLPGCRAFTELDPKDARIGKAELQRVLGPLPRNPEDQNRLWFKLSQQYADRPSVLQAHRQYLLTRELASFSALLFVVLPIVLVTVGSTRALVISYSVLLLFQYVITALAGKNYGKEFVNNVLALVGTDQKPRKAKRNH